MLYLVKDILIFGSIALLTSSCSTLNKEECKTANWQTIGYEDGARGYKASRIGQHRSACAKHGVQPNLVAYTTGRKQGLPHYCIPSTAYNKGLNGQSYNGVCKDHEERKFLNALNYGLRIHKEKNILKSMKNDYTKEERYISSLENELHKKENLIVSGKLTKNKALKLLNETKDIAVQLGKAKSNLHLISDDIQKQSQHINNLKNNYR